MIQAANPKGRLLSRLRPIEGLPLAPMRVPGFAGTRPLMSFILKTLAGDWRTIEKHLAFHLVWFEFGTPSPEIKALERALERKPSILGHAIDGMVETMRQLTDLWIDSGKSPTDADVDAPAVRNVEDVLPGQSESLFDWLDSILFARHPVYASLRRDGSMGLGDTFPRYSETHDDRSIEDRLREYGAKFAAHWFVKLLDSADARCIARCDACRSYLAYQRARLRTTKRGVFCSRCKGKGSSKRTEISRAKRLDTAARAWGNWLTKHTDPPGLQWIADRVNNAHGTAFGRRWVSQNLTKIQERMEAQRNAKG